MEILLCLLYVALCIAIFKIFKIPVNQWTLMTAVLVGLFGISLLLLAMNYNHPYTKNGRIYFTVTPIIPGVRGRVVEVPVAPNQPLKEGDVLFKVDPKPYQYVVDERKAALAEAEQNVRQLKASLDQATANKDRAAAQQKLAQDNYDRQAELFSKQVIAQATLDTYQRNLDTAKQSTVGAQAEEDRARLAYTSNIGGVNTSVARLAAELSDAQFDLDQTVTRAPSHGFVTQVTLRPGMYVVPIPLKPVMAFVNTDPKDKALTGAFWQNSLQRVKSGDRAEVAFAAVPGRVFRGKVGTVIDAIPTGQLPPSGTLIDVGSLPEGGRALATINLTDDVSGYNLPLGAACQIAIYTEHMEGLSLLRMILLRIRSWENYVFTEEGEGSGGGHGH
ncbi:HlyD family secretion protein [Bradyrhizobium tropiciagri]|uniref:HlyD family secretion protein n=1 Tax=Bradyrhizobium tropiciagri TaxID=312253 RepID=UPI001BADE48E|nr:HlyD family secretion protein [Bradyrhizobium tropiciagri]MBR0895143.1 HlyD family secretion protein [Bradyrhizobium tropiciagri]